MSESENTGRARLRTLVDKMDRYLRGGDRHEDQGLALDVRVRGWRDEIAVIVRDTAAPQPSAVGAPREAPPSKCPKCESPNPALHPSLQPDGGEVHLCSHPFHAPAAAQTERLSTNGAREAPLDALVERALAFVAEFQGDARGALNCKHAEALASAFISQRAELARLRPLTAPMAAGLLTTLKAECEAQHARAEQAESVVARLRAERVRLEHVERAYERLDLCPDHRDKANGRCLACQAEANVRAERVQPATLREAEETQIVGREGR